VLEGGLLGGEVAAGLDRAAEPGIQRLDRVGGADQRADLLVEEPVAKSREGAVLREVRDGVLESGAAAQGSREEGPVGKRACFRNPTVVLSLDGPQGP
jgi:hypothetical protein